MSCSTYSSTQIIDVKYFFSNWWVNEVVRMNVETMEGVVLDLRWAGGWTWLLLQEARGWLMKTWARSLGYRLGVFEWKELKEGWERERERERGLVQWFWVAAWGSHKNGLVFWIEWTGVKCTRRQYRLTGYLCQDNQITIVAFVRHIKMIFGCPFGLEWHSVYKHL